MQLNKVKSSFEERVGFNSDGKKNIFMRVSIGLYVSSLMQCTGDFFYEDLYINKIKPLIKCEDKDPLAKVTYELNRYAYNTNQLEMGYELLYGLLVRPYVEKGLGEKI